MAMYSLLGGTIVVVLSMIKDYNGTVKLVVAVITIRGLTWLCQKITGSINIDASQMINFTGWSLAGISIVGILERAIDGSNTVLDFLGKGNLFLVDVGRLFDGFSKFVDGMVFWN